MNLWFVNSVTNPVDCLSLPGYIIQLGSLLQLCFVYYWHFRPHFERKHYCCDEYTGMRSSLALRCALTFYRPPCHYILTQWRTTRKFGFCPSSDADDLSDSTSSCVDEVSSEMGMRASWLQHLKPSEVEIL